MVGCDVAYTKSHSKKNASTPSVSLGQSHSHSSKKRKQGAHHRVEASKIKSTCCSAENEQQQQKFIMSASNDDPISSGDARVTAAVEEDAQSEDLDDLLANMGE